MFFDCVVLLDANDNITYARIGNTNAIHIMSVGVPHRYPGITVIVDPRIQGTIITGTLTTTPEICVQGLPEALIWCNKNHPNNKLIVVGNLALYKQALSSPWLQHILVEKLNLETSTGTEKFPRHLLPETSTTLSICKQVQTQLYDFTNTEELAYLKLVERLLSAPQRPDRTCVGTHGLFHEVLKFTLSKPSGERILPLITSKLTKFALIFHELSWMLRGSTTTAYLKENNVHIWDGNSSREYLDAYGLEHYEPGEVGPVYGFQWRHAGAEYVNEETKRALDTDIPVGGIDQLQNVIDTLKRNPWDRRMLVCSWNVSQISKMALPPCHYSYQFHVDPDSNGKPKYLNCLVNMRSSDIFLGVPFNIASYALLTHMIADICDLTAGTLSLSMADCHLYNTHVDQAKLLITRQPRQFPTIEFETKNKKNAKPTIDTHTYSPINTYKIIGYSPAPYIYAPMAV